MFLDRVKISIKAGSGGDGTVSFLRNGQTMYGGPNGGDGGNGGNIIFKATNSVDTLYSFKFKKKFFAENGAKGEANNRTGLTGKDLIILVPCGTVILDATNNSVLADLTDDGEEVVLLKGGLGGKGNAFFKSSTRQAPKFSKSGEVTNQKEVILELKTIADVGLVGYPNVGKSTLLSRITNAEPKIGDYAFTTITPNLGVVKYYDKTFVVADIPGLIEGASEGAGLGHYFLKHVERVRLILHLVDISSIEGRDPVDDYFMINNELKKYDEGLSKLKQIIVLTKCDLLSKEDLKERVNNFKDKVKPEHLVEISSMTHQGLDKLIEITYKELEKIPKPEKLKADLNSFDVKDKSSIHIERASDGSFEVSGGKIEELIRGIVLSDEVSNAYFQKRLRDDGIIDMLKDKGLKNGDTVVIKDIVFEYKE